MTTTYRKRLLKKQKVVWIQGMASVSEPVSASAGSGPGGLHEMATTAEHQQTAKSQNHQCVLFGHREQYWRRWKISLTDLKAGILYIPIPIEITL